MESSPKHIKKYSDLVTSKLATRQGFLTQASQKMAKAESYIAEATSFEASLYAAKKPNDLLKNKDIHEQLLTSVGFSAKSLNHIQEDEKLSLLQNALDDLYKTDPDTFKKRLMYQYLLVRGDSLGGSMRNLTGAVAQNIFSNAIIASLDEKQTKHTVQKSKADKIQSIAWDKRIIVFDKTPAFIKKNIDVIVLNTMHQTTGKHLYNIPEAYIASGELKGGIDPAGADEHWKTARSALERIRDSFKESNFPSLFFVGAAIEHAMAKEIFDYLKTKKLAFAANLTVQSQLKDLSDFITSL